MDEEALVDGQLLRVRRDTWPVLIGGPAHGQPVPPSHLGSLRYEERDPDTASGRRIYFYSPRQIALGSTRRMDVWCPIPEVCPEAERLALEAIYDAAILGLQVQQMQQLIEAEDARREAAGA